MKNDNTKGLKRKDKKGRVLRTGESQQPDGRYRYSYTVSGKQKSVYSWKLEETDRLPAGKRQCMALRTLEKEAQEKINAGIFANKITAKELVENYLIIHDVNLKKNTKQSHQFAFDNMQKDLVFCNQKIVDIQIIDVKNFFLRLAEYGVSYNSILIVKSIVFPAFRIAFEDRLIAMNPCSFKFSDLMNKKSKKKQALTKEQMEEYLDFVKNSKKLQKYWAPLYILFHTGMRISEFCGLTLKDVNYRDKTIRVNKQLLIDRTGTLYVETTKSESGNRLLPMTDDVAECFKMLSKEVMLRKQQILVDGVSGFFSYSIREKGGKAIHPMCGENWDGRCTVIWNNFIKKYPDTEIPRVTPHVCRHTYCSHMAATGMPPKVLQTIMGHSDISTTMDVYAHVHTDEVKAAVDKVVKLA